MTNDVWHRWQFLFASDEKLKDKLIDRLEKLESEGVKWQGIKNYNIKEAFKHAGDLYSRVQKTQDVGKFIINFQEKDLIVRVKHSFYYEIDVCIPISHENKSIENIIKDFEKTNSFALEDGKLVCGDDDTGNIIKDYVLLDLQKEVVTWSIILNFYEYKPEVEVGNIKVEADVERLLNISLSKIFSDYAAISKTTNAHLFFASKYNDFAPLWFINFHDSPANCVESGGGTDLVHDIVSLYLAGELLKKEKQVLFEIESKISETNNRIYVIIEDTIKSKQDIGELKYEFLNVLSLKKNLIKSDEKISEIRRTTRGITEILNGIEETIIKGGGIIKHFCCGVEKRNEHVNFLMKKLYKSLGSLEQTILEAISTETLSGIHKSISIQEQISDILKSTHSMHVGILILEIVIFAEIFITLVEIYGEYHEISEMMRYELVIAAIIFGIICSLFLTRFITKNKIMERILK